MATFNPLLDPAPAPSHDPAADAQASPVAEQPNLFLGVLRRWPWLVLGLAVGLVLGLLYHMQRPPVYQSSAQLLVIKNRPEMTSAGDARVQFLEDYVATQVLYLRSERILEQAAKELDGKTFQAPPPATSGERVGFLMSRFSVSREKEPGANTPSNILLLTFRAPHPADAPLYLHAIIKAYQDNLATVYEGASVVTSKSLGDDVESLRASLNKIVVRRRELERELRGDGAAVAGISQEELGSIRARITANRASENTLKLRQIALARELDEIKQAGTTRAGRVAVMARLGITTDRPSIFGDLRDPDSMLAQLQFRRDELSVRLGPGHPDMVTLNRQITALEREVEKRGGPPEDELERHRRKLENELAAVGKQLGVLQREIAADETKTTKMAELQDQIDGLKAEQLRDESLIRDKEREKARVDVTKSVGGYKVEQVTRPAGGVQIAPVLTQSLLLGAVVGLLLGGGLGLWAELADRSFRSPADIRRRLGLPILGHIPVIRTTEPPEVKSVAALDPVLAVYLRPKSSEAEAVRGIRTQLLFSTRNRDHQVIQVTSPTAGDGKSTLAANLALALASANKRVVLVDCDFRKPRVHKLFAVANPSVGLASVVADQTDLGDAVVGCEVENLSLLPCGPRPSNPAELLTNPKFQEILAELRASYDFVILDTPPVLAVSDPAAVAPRADGVILVFRMTPNAGPNAERAKEELAAVSARVLGVVVNASSEREMGYGYGYGYKYDYQYSDSYTDPSPSSAFLPASDPKQ